MLGGTIPAFRRPDVYEKLRKNRRYFITALWKYKPRLASFSLSVDDGIRGDNGITDVEGDGMMADSEMGSTTLVGLMGLVYTRKGSFLWIREIEDEIRWGTVIS
jgi:hypothetical protein